MLIICIILIIIIIWIENRDIQDVIITICRILYFMLRHDSCLIKVSGKCPPPAQIRWMWKNIWYKKIPLQKGKALTKKWSVLLAAQLKEGRWREFYFVKRKKSILPRWQSWKLFLWITQAAQWFGMHWLCEDCEWACKGLYSVLLKDADDCIGEIMLCSPKPAEEKLREIQRWHYCWELFPFKPPGMGYYFKFEVGFSFTSLPCLRILVGVWGLL